jgi:hypothetical protein
MAFFRSMLAIASAVVLAAVWLYFFSPHLLMSVITPIVFAIRIAEFKTDGLSIIVGIFVLAVNVFFGLPQAWSLDGGGLILVTLFVLGGGLISLPFGGLAGLLVFRVLNWWESKAPAVFF